MPAGGGWRGGRGRGIETQRWQDVGELLDSGIDVVTNLNVQHLESLNDAVETLTGFTQPETVPDAFVASADRIDLVDVEPKVLRERIAEGAVFTHGEASSALVDVVALVVFVVVAVVTGALVDILTRQGVQVARARAEATGLARLLAQRLAADTDALSETMRALRRIFDLDSVALLRPSDGGWEIDDADGVPIPRGPEDAQFTIELADQRLLAINGSRLQEHDAELLQALLTAVRQLGERAQADALTAERAGPRTQP